MFEISRLEEEVGADGFASRASGFGARRQRVVRVALLPNAGVEDSVGQGGTVGRVDGDHGLVGDLFPVEQ